MPREIRNLTPQDLTKGDRVWVQGKYQKPVNPDDPIVLNVAKIINPATDQRPLCLASVAHDIWLARMLSGTEPDDTIHRHKKRKRTLSSFKAALRRVLRLFGELPTDALESLATATSQGSDVVVNGLTLKSATGGGERIASTVETLTKMLQRTEWLIDAAKKKRGPVLDTCKLNAAQMAYDLLTKYGRASPTTTSGGTFYLLASVLYEAITGSAEVDLDRQCRKVHRLNRATVE